MACGTGGSRRARSTRRARCAPDHEHRERGRCRRRRIEAGQQKSSLAALAQVHHCLCLRWAARATEPLGQTRPGPYTSKRRLFVSLRRGARDGRPLALGKETAQRQFPSLERSPTHCVLQSMPWDPSDRCNIARAIFRNPGNRGGCIVAGFAFVQGIPVTAPRQTLADRLKQQS